MLCIDSLMFFFAFYVIQLRQKAVDVLELILCHVDLDDEGEVLMDLFVDFVEVVVPVVEPSDRNQLATVISQVRFL